MLRTARRARDGRLAEAKLALGDCVPLGGAAHVAVDARDGHVEVEVEVEDDARDEDDEDGEGGVLEVGQLDLQREGGGCEREAAVRGRRL